MENRKVAGIKPSEAIENIEYARRWMGCESDFSEEALDMAIAALKKLEVIQTCTPPSDDWEHYADRLHDIAYQSGYEQGKKDAEHDRWTPVSDRPIDGDRLMMHLTDWWYSSFGQAETDESKAIKTVMDKIEQTLGEFALEKQEQSCDTCKHGYFGDAWCERCAVRFASHYEAEEEA